MFLILLIGCGVEPEEFYAQFPTAMCDRTATCLVEAVGVPGDLDASALCEDEWAAAIDDLESRGCEYDAGQAHQCLVAIEKGNCDERTAIYYECKKVYRGEGDTCKLDVSDGL